MGHLISEPKFKIPTPSLPANFWQVPYILPTKSIERDWDWILNISWHVIPTKDAYDVLMYSPAGDSPFFCFELNYFWEIAFSPTKGVYNEYNCILANIVRDVLKHVSDIPWGYVVHI